MNIRQLFTLVMAVGFITSVQAQGFSEFVNQGGQISLPTQTHTCKSMSSSDANEMAASMAEAMSSGYKTEASFMMYDQYTAIMCKQGTDTVAGSRR